MKYVIIRFYRDSDKPSVIVRKNLTLAEAKKHCNDPKTATADWFDGYEEQRRIDKDKLKVAA